MESSEKTETPRRSTRLLERQRAVTPDIPSQSSTLGPKALMRLNRSKQKLNASTFNKTVEINVIPPTPPSQKESAQKKSIANKSNNMNDDKSPEKVDKNNEEEKQEITKVVNKSQPDEKTMSVEDETTVTENVTVLEKEQEEKEPEIIKEPEESVEKQVKEEEVTKNDSIEESADKKEEKQSEIRHIEERINEKEENEEIQPEISNVKLTSIEDIAKANESEKMLLDESIISIPESPPLTKSTMLGPVKDATFSPEVDTSIQDTRPHIDFIPKNVTLRTSTPLSQRVLSRATPKSSFLGRDTPKLSSSVIKALQKMTPKLTENKQHNEETLNETFNDQVKVVNPLEKSILKSSRRKRSLSVADGESFMQKKVMFVSPEIMNIDTIDERMLQSFKEERENSIVKYNVMASGNGMRRKRSLSECGTPGKAKVKVPNFRAIHEQQFNKMEGISEYQQRKAERAKRLLTPSKNLAVVQESKEKLNEESKIKSKIPTRHPLKKVVSNDNLSKVPKPRPAKRSNSLDEVKKIQKVPEKKALLPRIFDENSKAPKLISKLPKTVASKTTVGPFNAQFTSTASTSTLIRSKVDERREKNISMYKGNAVRTALDHRKKNENMLKGVRLNRRFELQMQHRRIGDSEN